MKYYRVLTVNSVGQETVWFNIRQVQDAEVVAALSMFSNFTGALRQNVRAWFQELLNESQVSLLESAISEIGHAEMRPICALTAPARARGQLKKEG